MSFHSRASLHNLALQMDAKQFPVKSHREWTHRAIAVSAAVRTLLDGKNPPPLTGKHKQRGIVDVEDLANFDEELS